MTECQLLGDAADVPEGVVKTFKAGDRAAVVARIGGRYCAVDARCPHMSGDLGRGKLESGALVCPVHASRFDMCTGEVLDWAPNLGSVRLPGPLRGLLATIKPRTPVRTHTVELDGRKLYMAGCEGLPTACTARALHDGTAWHESAQAITSSPLPQHRRHHAGTAGQRLLTRNPGKRG